MVLQLAGQRFHIVLRAADVVAGLVVPRFGQRCHGADGGVLQLRQGARAVGHLLLQKVVVVGEQIPRSLELQVVAHARHGDGGVDGLGDVVHCAQLQPHRFVVGGAHGGEENHRNVFGLGVELQAPQHLVAIHVRHHDVEQDQVGLFGRHDLQRAFAGGCQLDLVVGAQEVAHQRQIARGVIHHQHRAFAAQFQWAIHELDPPCVAYRSPPCAARRAHRQRGSCRAAASCRRRRGPAGPEDWCRSP
ncbi:hypothetical protein D3C71_1292000 [compost metagenome]